MSTETQNNALVSAELGAKVDAIVQIVQEMAQEKPTSVNAYGLSTWTKAKKLITDLVKSYSAPVAAQPDLTQQTLEDVMAGIPARDAEIEALRKEIDTLRAQQPVSGADGLPQAMLPARPTPEASNTFGLGLDGYTGAQMLTYGRACAEAQRKADSQAKLSGNTGELAREFANRIDQHQRTLANIEAFVACDASAISYLSLGEYRTALLKMLREAPAAKETGA